MIEARPVGHRQRQIVAMKLGFGVTKDLEEQVFRVIHPTGQSIGAFSDLLEAWQEAYVFAIGKKPLPGESFDELAALHQWPDRVQCAILKRFIASHTLEAALSRFTTALITEELDAPTQDQSEERDEDSEA
jgi:hypothetical protein